MVEPLLKVEGLRKWFPLRRSSLAFFRKGPQLFVKAVDGVDFEVYPGEILGLVGESGCGKTTTARLVLRLIEPTSGKILFEGRDITKLKGRELKEFRRKAQIIFQDPYESLNPRMTIFDIIAEPLKVHGVGETPDERLELVCKILEAVQLVPPEEFLFRYPHELSGGQRQRVAIARALVLRPKFIVADEPVSMLDMSIRADILNLMMDLREQYGLTYIYITHDLATARYVCNRIAIMYLGKIVEIGPADEVIDNPQHPYAKALISAIPIPDPDVKMGEIPIKGEVPSPIFRADEPKGCRFYPRCPYATERCKHEEPPLVEVGRDHYAACWLLVKG